ncbi:MAG: hypothetical protein Q8L01_02150 [Candidatus Woesebacteria bacterium]|nr:hypothetical protein [Candidatus Woesebacteria bacterium]
MEKIKKVFIWLFFFLLKILYLVFLWIFFPKKILPLEHGWDTLHPFSPFSYSGIPKKDFLNLYNRMKNGKEISSKEYYLAEYGSFEPTREDIRRKYLRKELAYKYFSFKKANS